MNPAPRAVEFRVELPRTRAVKLDYRVLAQEHAAGQDSKGMSQ